MDGEKDRLLVNLCGCGVCYVFVCMRDCVCVREGERQSERENEKARGSERGGMSARNANSL